MEWKVRRMLSCREITELATAYTEGALPFMTRWKFRLHLSMCGPCRRYVKQLRLTAATLGHLPQPPPEPSPEAREALLKTFRNWRGPQG